MSAEQHVPKMRKLVVWTVVATIFVIVGFVGMNKSQKTSVTLPSNDKEFQYKKQPSIGSDTAPVKIVEFADFKCPACKQFSEGIFPQLYKDFIDKGIVQLYYINYTIVSPDADSKTAAMASEAVYQQNPKEFWKFYKEVYARQGDEQANWATSDFLVKIAKESKVDVDYQKLKQDIDSNKFSEDVKSDKAIVRKLGLHSTPTLFINGKQLSTDDTFDYDVLKAEILKSQRGSGKY
ncbi:protein-disulfide isomerase [Aneurinibacillus soli]|uniref:Disulfide bond formation protein D n=1 Tax=Aneurinibacillus soli TaxID=1500254 RepID=A0A0U5B304_9BACL|nr:thioredoxin domain-containing protein [Aneurinibacillus soli]PYE62947.1 protein-disulfide isomerase [Aneurinibacillus soli]BAU28994.1 Disulfide bond formation protein D precursor [Aneurinibacillus soli]